MFTAYVCTDLPVSSRRKGVIDLHAIRRCCGGAKQAVRKHNVAEPNQGRVSCNSFTSPLVKKTNGSTLETVSVESTNAKSTQR